MKKDLGKDASYSGITIKKGIIFSSVIFIIGFYDGFLVLGQDHFYYLHS
ncbi:hypothetical protein bcere0022_15680 [Bacillus cereus Rock3-44]|nr:hypothetical protein bcere0022_15680 [Bacillus cereus Rock3-44]